MKRLKKGSKEDKKSKQELQQELTEAQKIIENQEDQLEKCAKELQDVKGQLGDYEKLKEKLASAEKQLDSIKELKKINDDLKKQMQNTERNASEQIEKIKKELQAAEEERSELLKTIDQHKNEIESLKNQLKESEAYEIAIAESLPTSKSTFRIDIYPYQGHYQGKIEHLLSKAKKPFKGLGENAIKEFISRHLPILDGNHKRPKYEIASEVDQEKPEEIAPTGNIPNLKELKIIQPDTGLSGKTLYQDQSLEVVANFNLAGINLETKGPVEHKITVYANSLEGKTRHIVAEAKGTIRSPEEGSIRMMGNTPPAGTYRLMALVALSSSKATPQQSPISSFFSGELFHVH